MDGTIVRKMKIICSICLDQFNQKSDVSSTPCGHLFHSNCISKSLVFTKNECPQCRANCSRNVHKVFLQCEPESHDNFQSKHPLLQWELDEPLDDQTTYTIDR